MEKTQDSHQYTLTEELVLQLGYLSLHNQLRRNLDVLKLKVQNPTRIEDVFSQKLRETSLSEGSRLLNLLIEPK